MKNFSIIFLVGIAVLAMILHDNGIQAADEDDFEEGKYTNVYLDLIISAFAYFDKNKN
jgi:hypothetical protein